MNILLDMDEVLSGFFEGALGVLNKLTGKEITKEQYVEENGGWKMASYFGVKPEKMWTAIDSDRKFWSSLPKTKNSDKIYNYLKDFGEITVVSSPSRNPYSWADKVKWLKDNFNIKSKDVILGSKKYLLAGNGVLIDDSPDNIAKFEKAGGFGILIPAEWNTLNLDFELDIKPVLSKGLSKYLNKQLNEQ